MSDTSPTVQVEGLREFRRVLRIIAQRAPDELRDASQQIASDLISLARRRAPDRQARLAVDGLRAVRTVQVPYVAAGRRRVRPGVRAQDVFYGAEFGGQRRPTTQQFPPFQGQSGRFLYPTLAADGPRLVAKWVDAVDDVFRVWKGGA